jgi:hypothetical protein
VLITFFDIKGTVHFELIQQGQKVNQAYYVETMKRLLEDVHRKRPELWTDDWIIRHDNAPTNEAFPVKKFLAKKLIAKIERPPYSPHLALNDFWLFTEIKFALKGPRFQDTEDIQNICDNGTERYFTAGIQKKTFQQWQHRWAKCKAAQEEYFEGDRSH